MSDFEEFVMDAVRQYRAPSAGEIAKLMLRQGAFPTANAAMVLRTLRDMAKWGQVYKLDGFTRPYRWRASPAVG